MDVSRGSSSTNPQNIVSVMMTMSEEETPRRPNITVPKSKEKALGGTSTPQLHGHKEGEGEESIFDTLTK